MEYLGILWDTADSVSNRPDMCCPEARASKVLGGEANHPTMSSLKHKQNKFGLNGNSWNTKVDPTSGRTSTKKLRIVEVFSNVVSP